MKQILCLFLTCPWVLLLCIACCTTKPEQSDEIIMNTDNYATEAVTGETIISGTVATEEITANQYDPVKFNGDLNEFVRELTNGIMEIVNVYPDSNIESRIGYVGQEVAGRRYFEYRSPLYPRPITGTDESFNMFAHQAMIARHVRPAYILSLDMAVRNSASEELERKTLTLNVQPGIKIQDLRRESKLKYTLKDTVDGSFHYGYYLITSAVVTQNESEAEAYNALELWMENAEISNISTLFETLLKKGVNYEN
jgi:hypothetical protein